MPFDITNYLLIDIDNDFSRALAGHSFNSSENNAPSTLVIAGNNMRQLVKMMFDELIKDYCYCDFENEISVSELASYLHEHHDIKGVLFNHTDYYLPMKNNVLFIIHCIKIDFWSVKAKMVLPLILLLTQGTLIICHAIPT